MRQYSPAFPLLMAGILSVLVLTVPVPGRADPAASPPGASDIPTDSQTIQRDIQQRYQQMGAAQREAHKKLQDPSLHPSDPNTREEDPHSRQQQQEEEEKTPAPER